MPLQHPLREALAVLLLWSAVAAAQEVDPRRARIELSLAAAEAQGFSGQVLVLEAGGLFVERGIGLADRESGVAITPETLFDIGSISKEFTRALVLELAARGELSLEDPLSEHFEDLPADKAAITIEQVLSHRAGFHEYHDTEGDFEPMDRGEALGRILSQELLFEPGSDEAYSNSGYTLLAALVELRSGKGFQEFLRQTILEPAGMKTTGFYGDPRWGEGQVARGYEVRTFGDNSPRTWPQISWALLGSGGMVSTARELSRWQQAVRNDRILSDETRRALVPMLAPDERMRISAGANDFGFVAYSLRAPGGRDVIVLTNSGMKNAERLTMELGAILTGRRMEAPERRADSAPEFPDSPTGRRCRALYEALKSGEPEALRGFLDDNLTAELRASRPIEEVIEDLRLTHDELGDFELIGLAKTGAYSAGMTLEAGGLSGAVFRFELDLEEAEPHRIAALRVESE